MRRTIAREVVCEGVALHSGQSIRMALCPAAPGSGVIFRRRDLGNRSVAARYDKVTETRLGTVLGDESGASAGVVEHLMAAIAGAEIDDILVSLDGPEPPILDGDALSYLRLLDSAGIDVSPSPRHCVRIRQRVAVGNDEAWAALEPFAARAFELDIDFASRAIGHEKLAWTFSQGGFRREIAPARTFGFFAELETLHAMGLAKGASLDNTLAIDGDRVVNAAIMRFADEFVRHKLLDALGDLALAGVPIIGRFVGHRSGHALNNALLRAVFADAGNYERSELA